MILAVKAVREHIMGYKMAAKHFVIPKGTLKRYIKNTDFSLKHLVSKSLGRKPVLSQKIEAELVQYCLVIDIRYFGLRRSDV
ncbi:hypothetical protein ANTQUA_LOCUS6886 [Anthophora quadrimaculata]